MNIWKVMTEYNSLTDRQKIDFEIMKKENPNMDVEKIIETVKIE